MAVSHRTNLRLLQFPLICSSERKCTYVISEGSSNSNSLIRSLFTSKCNYISLRRRRNAFLFVPVTILFSRRVKCFTKSTDENWALGESIDQEWNDDGDNNDDGAELSSNSSGVGDFTTRQVSVSGNQHLNEPQKLSSDSLSLGIKEPIYEVVEVKSNGEQSIQKISRRQLLKSSGLRPRDIRSVDPSLWMTNSAPTLLVREHAILFNLGSLRAIAMQERVLIFDYNRKGAKAFLEHLLPRLVPKDVNGVPSMPFELEVVEAALVSRIQRYERRLMDVEPRVVKLLEVLPNRLTADVLEQLRLSKQTLVELGSRAGALKQMLLDLLEDPDEIRRMCIMGRDCTIRKGSTDMDCAFDVDKQIAEEEEEEIEMLLENYLQRCESCHAQAERLLDSAKEMEDSIAVNLSSRRLEVSRVELLLQVGTFFVAIGALVAGIFGMNLKSYLEEHVFAFWWTTGGIILGAFAGFFLMYTYLKARKILY
ncbi:magnesium transporter MRS2-11, chloroplastic-like [Papaver somniferum]|uniref:magnesium transporter MRS2-11, chloroplastic-like n=1 Tax=Papaver somniferum TaxID=3469 RepID=UPI000E6F9801|nr:magnesium transporter MRS2-11, chloroplastic-like [Papaver somniferum]XP_026417846.1 magnesium transporter MRS2-11, chloroplastic-like [Papaver somniferum]XP_026417847.1 magnesium transporter MRS2-11, chloroplastic-like [Papaver somniferum]